MRLIDADQIQYTMLYKENWMTGTGMEAQGVWKEEIDKMPTVEINEDMIIEYCRKRCLVIVAGEHFAELVMSRRIEEPYGRLD